MTELAYIEGTNTNWRDMKSYGNYIYGVADGNSVNDGLLIIDMSQAPETITHHFENPEVIINDDTSYINHCHNLFLDENGFAYLTGCNTNGGAPLIFDCTTDPAHPKFVGAVDGAYAHDIYARGDTLWNSDIYAGQFSAWDVTDKANPVLMGSHETSFDFTHNAWLSDDGNYLFTTDEVSNAYTDAFDVSDLNDIKQIGTYRPPATEGTGVAPHNVHYKNGYLIISHYSDGVKIVDAHRPENMIEVGSFDTYTGNGTGFNGCWGAFPFLPSGLVLASDRSTGLYVLEPQYKRAAYLEGIVSEEGTNQLLSNVKVEIVSDQATQTLSNSLGIYKTGQVETGEFQVNFSLPGYASKTVSANLSSGQLTTLDVKLTKLPRYNFSGKVVEDASGLSLADATISIANNDFTYELKSDENGNFNLTDVILGDYFIYAGMWGYKNIALGQQFNNNIDLTIRLQKGYQDDFVIDQGWSSTGDARTGQWELGVPIGTTFGSEFSNPSQDVDSDLGNSCYITGNGGGSVGFDDVDDGTVSLTSPTMDLSTYEQPTLRFHTWFYNASGGNAPNDTLKIFLQSGNELIQVDTITDSSSEWSTVREYALKDYFGGYDDVQIIFEATDMPGTGNLLEAGVDAFEAFDAVLSHTVAIDQSIHLQLAPNPFHEQMTVNYQFDESPNTKPTLLIYNYLGQQLKTIPLSQNEGNIQIGADLPIGIYFLRIYQNNKLSKTKKFIKQ